MPRPERGLRAPSSSLRIVLACGLLATAGATAAQDAPGRSPSRLAPAQGLTFYLEYDGLDAHAEAWKGTAAREVLNGTPAGALMTEFARGGLDRLLKVATTGPLTAADLMAFEDQLVHRGFAVASYENRGVSRTVFILPRGEDPEALGRFHRILRFLLKPEDGMEPIATRTRGRDVYAFRRPQVPDAPAGDEGADEGPTWWIEDGSLIFLGGPNVDYEKVSQDPDVLKKIRDALEKKGADDAVDAIDPHAGLLKKALAALEKKGPDVVLDAIEGKTPKASSHPGLAAAREQGRDLAGFVPAGLFLFESVTGGGVVAEQRARFATPFPVDADVADAAGLGRSGRVVGRWGFRGKALLTDVRFEANGPWSGMAGMLDSAGLRKDRLPPIHRGSGAFAVGSFRRGLDPESLAVLRVMKLTAGAAWYLEVADRVLADPENRRLVAAVVDRLGPTGCVYNAVGERAAGVTLLMSDRDVAALDQALGTAVARLNAFFREEEFGPGDLAKPDARPPALALERLPAPDRGYRLTSPSGRIPWITELAQPTILLGEAFAVVAFNPDLARAAVTAELQPAARWEPSGAVVEALKVLPSNPSLLIVGAPRDSPWPDLIADLSDACGDFSTTLDGILQMADPAGVGNSGLLTLLGTREPSAPAPSPKADDLRRLLFPSVLAATIDDRGLRITSLEALPFACLPVTYETEGTGPAMTMKFGLKSKR
ncbi:hypothetical protein [Paludisphaera mucosa]|uniref:Uncharacterized protein n=1 Tax=Paludisphaera mucosa TaxID=3030827 RepID=A0ABT6FIL9_9BACT|nr:hypothetical protein [Paludisphaera mucosa]MDG3007349.1 hypothetical protein [Paludisphaera mucosa]